MPDVIKFGAGTYVGQHPRAIEMLDQIAAEAAGRGFRDRRGFNAYLTRRLREAGLAVATRGSMRSGARIPLRSGWEAQREPQALRRVFPPLSRQGSLTNVEF